MFVITTASIGLADSNESDIMKSAAIKVRFFSQLGCLEIVGVKHAVYNGENLIGRDTSCCSISVSSKVGLNYSIYFAENTLTHFSFIYHRVWVCWN
jgi:hypothetical protein